MQPSIHSLALAGVLTTCLFAAPAFALPLISEVFYDGVGSDNGQSFVELYGAPGTPLDGLVLEGINGAGGGVTVSIVLSGSIAADGLYLLADLDTGGGTLVPEPDAVANFDFQNGPDSVVLREVGGAVLDAVAYGVFDPGEVFAGEGDPVADAPAGSSIARFFADVDSDDNAFDFAVLGSPTPGTAPLSVPEPSTGLLAFTALAVLAAKGSRSARERSLRPAAELDRLLGIERPPEADASVN